VSQTLAHEHELFAPQRVDVERCSDGSRIFRSSDPLRAFARSANDALARGAATFPERTFVAEAVRTTALPTWRTLSYGEALRRARAIAQGLLDAGAAHDRPVVIAAENGIAHALVTFAAHEIGVPIVPLAPIRVRDETSAHANALVSLLTRLRPAVAFVDDARMVQRLASIATDLTVASDLDALERTPSDDVATRAQTVDEATVAKIMLTSGTTGAPKGVLTTHGMIVSNQTAISQAWPFFDREPPILVDWLPWSHSFGGTKIVHFTLHRGGTLYVDDGLPTARDVGRSLANLRTIAPTVYFNVPRGYALLVAALETDAELRAMFFSRLRLAFCAAASLPSSTAERFARVRALATSRAVPLTYGWGLTETAPSATCVQTADVRAGEIGIPLPGVEIKLAPVDGGDELRVRGPNVTPGYAGDTGATRAAFDDDGFFRSGDAATLVDETHPERGFRFGGRLCDTFKLSTGVWVRTAALRDAVLEATAPLVAEVLLTGDDADEVCAIFFLEASARDDRELRSALARALTAVATRASGRNDRVARALIAREALSVAAGELTAKGTLNRNVALRARARDVARLHAADAHLDPEIVQPA